MLIRDAQPIDGHGIHRVHVAAVRELCADHYSAEQIQAWAGGKHGASYDEMLARHVAFVAVDDEQIVGFSQLHVAERKVEAVYIAPAIARRGVGSMLLQRLEAAARSSALVELQLSASLNAVPFYAANGYSVVREGSHRLNSGIEIPCVHMSKGLA
jgi:putative acetyltransferase